MRGYFSKALEWFKAFVQKLIRFFTRKPRRRFSNNRVFETHSKKQVTNSPKAEKQDKLSNDEHVNQKSSPFTEVDTYQKPPNYPSMPKRELLVDKPFESVERRNITDSFSSPAQQDFASVTPKSSSPKIKPKRTKKEVSRKRPYIKYRTSELEKIANLEWDNRNKLVKIHHELQFRTRKKALTLLDRIAQRLAQLQSTEEFSWPTTQAENGSQNISREIFKYEQGLLKHCGYRVGAKGLPANQRRQILDDIFLRPLPSTIDNNSYLNEWGQPNTAKRLKKLAESIAAFTRNAKRRNTSSLDKAIQDWEDDLTYLKLTYYNGSFYFQWPRTGGSDS